MHLQAQAVSQLSACSNIILRLPVGIESLLLKCILSPQNNCYGIAGLICATLSKLQILQALQDRGCYGSLTDLPDITSKLLAKQIGHLEDIMFDLRDSV